MNFNSRDRRRIADNKRKAFLLHRSKKRNNFAKAGLMVSGVFVFAGLFMNDSVMLDTAFALNVLAIGSALLSALDLSKSKRI